MSFLDTLIYGYRTILNGGVAVTQRNKVNFVGCTVADNPTTGATDVTPAGGGGGSSAGADGDVQIGDGASGFKVDTANFAYDSTNHTLVGGEGCTIGGGAVRAIAFGHNCQANADNSVSMGTGCISSFANSVCIGNGCGDGGQNSVCMGSGCSTTGSNGVALGVGSNAGTDCVALGDACSATGTASFACGLSCTTTRWGEFGHAGGAPNAFDGTHGIDVGANLNATPGNLVLGDASELTLVDSRAYSIRVRVVAAKSGGGTFAHEVHEILAHGNGGGTLVIDEDDLITAPAAALAAAGWTLTISASGLILRVACDPAANNVHFGARVEWSSIAA